MIQGRRDYWKLQAHLAAVLGALLLVIAQERGIFGATPLLYHLWLSRCRVMSNFHSLEASAHRLASRGLSLIFKPALLQLLGFFDLLRGQRGVGKQLSSLAQARLTGGNEHILVSAGGAACSPSLHAFGFTIDIINCILQRHRLVIRASLKPSGNLLLYRK